MGNSFFELSNISKYFAKVIANKDISFSIEKGEVVALLGENGAGKSTIMKILYGLYKADEGVIKKNGVEVKINSPKEAMALGISMIQQHFSLVPAHTVTENIMLGNVHGRIDYKRCEEEVKKLSKEYGFEVPITEKVEKLDVGIQQKIEILKALYLKAELLIMDEPTAVLTPQESEKLMEFVKSYTEKGNAVIFITHKLKEVMEVADRIIVMRNGRMCGNLKKEETNELELSKLMIGEELATTKREEYQGDNKKKLEIMDVYLEKEGETPILSNISFDIKEGEIFGIAGVSGNGQEELCEVIMGARKATRGSIRLNGEEIHSKSIRERIQMGIGYVPVDRHRDGMIASMSVAENMMLKNSFDTKWMKHGIIQKKKLNHDTQKAIQEYKIKTPSPDVKAGGLSGGNQQKVVLAREVEIGKELLILNQPTRGLDLGAIHNIHTVVLRERKAGKSILLVSTELSEIFEMCDRIAVMYKGKIQGIYKAEDLNTEKIGLLMAGYSIEMEETENG